MFHGTIETKLYPQRYENQEVENVTANKKDAEITGLFRLKM